MSYLVYVDLNENNPERKTGIWRVQNQEGIYLGEIKWFTGWRKYVFYPKGSVLFDAKCLIDITEFLNKKMEERKDESKTE